ncbi:hypothetical protein [Pandoraea sp. NPDC087047]|uniref:hypothetical protein n=1 Tax=Pandoraea sp. NPDC087047 TaxID=3364390 RepID=UPI00381A7610
MTCLDKWMIGACVVTLSGVALAGGTNTGSSEQMIMANLGPSPLPILVPPPAIPIPSAVVTAVPVTLYPFGRESQGAPERVDRTPNADLPLYTRIEAINHAPPTGTSRHADWIDTAPASTAAKPTHSYLNIGSNLSPKLSLVEWNNADDKLGSDPKRGLAVKTDDWSVSATAHVPLLGQHDIGATVYVKRRF